MESGSSSEFPKELQSEAFDVLSSNDNTAMETLFSHLYSPETQLQTQALTFLQCCKHHHPDLLFIKLFFLLRCIPSPHTRANAARVLLLLKPSELWPNLRPVAQAHIKAHFLEFLAQESSIQVLRVVSLVLAQTLSVIYVNNQCWPEILDFLLSSLSSNDDNSREVALLVFASLPNECRLLLSDALRDVDGAVRLLHSSILNSLASPNLDIRVTSFRAVVCLIRVFSDPPLFHELLRGMMLSVFALLQGFEGSHFRSAFGELVNLVKQEPSLLKPYANDMVIDALQIAESNGLSKETHCLSFELVMAMTEVKEWETVLMNLPHETLIRLFSVPMKMLEVDDGERESEVFKFGMKCLEQLAVAVGGTNFVPVAYELLPLHLDATEWKTRQAGITMLTVIAKEFSDEMVLMENFLAEVVTKILKSFRDSHVQVRLAALNFMETPTNFVQAMQLLYHHRLMHAFAIALDDSEDHTLKEHVASAMLFFLKNTLPDSLMFYKNVDNVMAKLFSLLQVEESVKLRSIALSTLNIVAQRCQEVAHGYCANYLPILLEACKDKNSDIKEEAVRGFRICAECGTPQLKPFINGIMSELDNIMNDPNGSILENAKVHDIAVSALGRICEFHRVSIDGSKVVPSWLSFLPLKNDLVEAKVMHEQLCLMVARLDKDLLGPDGQNLAKIISVFLEVIDKGDELATPQTVKQMNNLLRQLGRNIPHSALDAILSSLSTHQQELFLPLVSS